MPEIGTSGLMSGDGKRGDGQVAPKLPRPSSTYPNGRRKPSHEDDPPEVLGPNTE
jgi:hypothetical protein